MKSCCALSLAVVLMAGSASAHGPEKKPHLPAGAESSASQGLVFVENRGQWNSKVTYKASLTGGISLFAEKDRFTYVLTDTRQLQAMHEDHNNDSRAPINCHAFQMRFIGSNPNTEISGFEERPFYHNYFIGNDQSAWATRVPVFGGITYKNIYEGIDLSMYGSQGTLKYDYHVQAGASPEQIVIDFTGARKVSIHQGRLVVETSVGDLVESIPESYQVINGEKVGVSCEFLINGEGEVKFRVGNYDPAYELVIDPVVMASTYSGGTASSYGHCATFDASGNIYSGARCFGTGYPVTTGAFQTTFGGSVDMAISKLDPNGINLLYATYIGGSSSDLPHSLFVDTNGNLFVFGTTKSNNYPTSTGAYDNSFGGQDDIVISKLNSTGTSLAGSTYVGGSAIDGVNSSVMNYSDNFRGEIVVNGSGEPYITSVTTSTNFPVTSGAYDGTHNGGQDAVLFKMDANLTSLSWSTFFGGTSDEAGFSLRLDVNGDVLITGFTEGPGFPTTTGALNTTYQGGQEDGYVARFNSTGTSLINSSFIGTNQRDMSFFVELDATGGVYLFGNSLGSMPITSGVYNNVGSMNFLMKLASNLGSVTWATVLGGGSLQQFSPSALMVDVCQNVYMSGWGSCAGYPLTTNAVQTTTLNSGFYLMVLDGTGTNLTYGGPFGYGGEHVDGGTSRFDPNGVVYQGVCACNMNFPTLSNNFSPTNLAGGCDVAVFKIDFQTNCTGFSSNTVICGGSSATFSITNFGNLGNATYSVQPGNIPVTNQVFSVSPASNMVYTVYITGTNTLNATVTQTGTAVVVVMQQPTIAPVLSQMNCTSTANGFSLNLGFVPTLTSTPSYSILWAPTPGGINNNTMTESAGPVTPGVYSATITAQSGCSVTTNFTMTPQPPPVNIIVNGPFVVDCAHPTLTISLSPAALNYTWTNPFLTLTGNTNTFNVFSQPSWTVFGLDPIYGCSNSTVFTISTNTSQVSSVLTPTYQNITCTVNSIQTVTSSITPTVNVVHYWMSPFGGTLMTAGPYDVFMPGAPGTYTHIALNTSNGCTAVKTFTVFSNSGFPTFTLSSPQNFSVGCAPKNIAVVNIVNAQTTPTAGGAISYTMLSPGHTGNYNTGTQSSYTNITTPGTYTFIVKSAANACETKVQTSILQFTAGPQITAVVPIDVITCDDTSVILEGTSTNTTTEFTWQLGGGTGVTSHTVTIFDTGVETQTVAGTYTLVGMDPWNACKSQTVVTILQNIIPPIAAISGPTEISCKTTSITLSNISTSRIPPYFNPSKFVAAALWQGPSPQVPVQLSSSYVAREPGTYTMIARDVSNGCTAIATKTVADNRNYPLVNIPAPPPPYILDCGSSTATISAIVEGDSDGYLYDWHAHSATVSSTSDATITVNMPGTYEVHVLDPDNGCESSGFVEVQQGTLTADFSAAQSSSFAPTRVEFFNHSLSSSASTGTSNIVSVWSFGNGTLQSTSSTSINPFTMYTQPGTYTVTMYATKGSCVDTMWQVITVEIPSRVTIPNVFTPNGDGVNDLLFVNGAMLEHIEVTIFNRWGEIVYQLTSTTGNFEWDGHNRKGEQVPDGNYLMVLKARGKDAVEYEHKGTVSLVR